MALKVLNKVKFTNFVRQFSNESKLISVNINDKTGVATVTLQRPPVNSLNLELLTDLKSAITDLEKNKARGIILTSNSNTVFSGGLDILEVYKPKPERLTAFWTTLQDFWIKLYGCPIPTVAVINGHAPAGGCLTAVSCEYRIMSKNFTIGLNETQLGLVAPKWFMSSMRNVIGQRQTELAVTTGRLFKTDEAFSIGLVDEVVENKEEGLARAEKFLGNFKNVAPEVRSFTKKLVREQTIMEMVSDRENDLKTFVNYANQPKVQMYLEKYMEMLKAKSAKN